MAVINGGHLSDAMDVQGISVERVGLLMGGVHGAHAAIDRRGRGSGRPDGLERSSPGGSQAGR